MARDIYLKDGGMGATAIATVIGLMAFASDRPAVAHVSMTAREVSEGVKTYKIPQGSAAEALNRLADESGVRMIYRAQLTKNLHTRGLSGSYTLTGALDALLSGTGLQYRLSEDGRKVSIVLAQNDSGTQNDAVPAGAEPLPTIDVGAARPVAGGSGDGQGTSPGIAGPAGSETGTGPGGYGGAGPAQDPYNKSYDLQNASTGTKTNTPVMDTPLNVQVVSQQALRDQQATTLSQALQNVSGVQVLNGVQNLSSTGSSGILVRGFATETYYRDGFRIDAGSFDSKETISTRQLADVASVEVLKGPGAILYGLVDPGGIINITTKEPLAAPYYAVNQQIGSLADYRTTVDATGPLNTDKSLLYRINMSYENNGAPYGSFIDFTHSQSLFVAPVVKWIPDDATWVKLEAEYTQTRSNTYNGFDPLFNGAFVTLPRNVNFGATSPYQQSTIFGALTWYHQFDKDWSIKQQIAYLYNFSYQNNFLPLLPTFIGNIPAVAQGGGTSIFPNTTYSTNVDITGHINTFGAEHTLLLGGDDYWSTGNVNNNPRSFISSANFLFNPINLGTQSPLCVPVLGGCYFDTATYWQNTAGLYLQDQVKLPYNFFLLTGARYQYISQGSKDGTAQYDLTPQPNLTAQALTPRFGLLWRPQEWLSVYGNYAQNFGANVGTVWPGTLPPPTNSESWEAGAKFEFFNGKLRVTADYFELVKTNVPIADPNPTHSCNGGGVGSCEIIAGAARSTGPELDIQGEILPGWSVTANYTNDDVRITKAAPGANPGIGQRLPSVPRNIANLFTTYEFQNDSVLKGLKIGAGYHYVGSSPVNDSGGNPPWAFPLVPSYGTVDLMAAYSFVYAGSKITSQVNVTNLFDRTYYPSEFNAFPLVPGPGQGASYRAYGAPFAIMGSLGVELDKGTTPPPWLLPTPTAAPSLPSFTWTGLYAGGQMGYGWGLNDGTIDYATAQGQIGHSNLTSAAQGVIGGAHLGYNQQFERAVLGLEASVDGVTVTKNIAILGPNIIADPYRYPGIGAGADGNVQSGVQASIRARAGYAFGRLLPYATGGVAFGSFKSDAQLFGVDLNAASFGASGSNSATRVGWTLGAGLEYAINNSWSARAEYRYSDFGHLPISTDPWSVGAVFAVDRHLDQQQVQVGFSYKLFAGPEPEAPPAPLIVKGPALADSGAPGRASASPPSLPFAMNWTGFYVGAHIGYGWGLNDGSLSYATPGGLAGQSNLNGNAIVFGGGGGGYNGDAIGVIGGVHLGYNQQFDKWVVGLEGSVDPTLMRRSPEISVPDLLADPTGALGIGVTGAGGIWSQIQGSVRARAGYALDRMLFYGTAGLAIGQFGSTFQLYGNDTNLAPFYAGDLRSVTRVGWTAGAGVEYAINPHWSVRGEYRYTDFGHMGDSPAPTSTGVLYTADRHLDQQQVEVGVSYHFNGGATMPVAATTSAANLPSLKGPAIQPPPPASWTGFHAGVNLGGGWSINNNNSTNYLPFTDPAFPFGSSQPLLSGGFLPNLVYLPGDNGYTNKTDGVVGGGQFGYDFQLGKSIVIGAEADIQRTTIASGHNGAYLNVLASPFVGGSVLLPLGGGAPVGNVGAPWFGTVRGRAGGLVNPTLLLYGTGGFAYGGLDVAGYSTTAAGWTVGAGGEWMFAPNWSAKLEYLYMNLTGSANVSGGVPSGTSSKLSPAINVVRGGLSYHFNWAAPAPVVAKY